MASFNGRLVALPSPFFSDVLSSDAPIVDGDLFALPAFGSSAQAFFLPAVGGATVIINPQGGMGAMKGQYIASEDLRIVIPPFLNTATNQFITTADVVTLTIKKPDNTLLAPASVAVRDTDTNFWIAIVPLASFLEGEWLIKAESNAADTLPQFISLVWGDYMTDIRQATLGRWKIVGTQLLLYGDDGTTVFRTFNLKNSAGLPSVSQIFERDPV